jgi:hypothetical protein
MSLTNNQNIDQFLIVYFRFDYKRLLFFLSREIFDLISGQKVRNFSYQSGHIEVILAKSGNE